MVRSFLTMKPSPALSSQLLAELLPIVRNVSAVLDPEELAPTIARELRRVVDYRFLDVFLPRPDGSLKASLASEGTPGASRFQVGPGEGIVGAAAESRQVVFVPDVTRDPRYVPAYEDVGSELAIPLLHRGRLVGVLNIEARSPDVFHPEARAALELLASHLAVAIENATLYRQTRWYAGLLATLNEAGKETSSILELDELLQRIAEIVHRVIDYEWLGILLLDERTQELVTRKTVRYSTRWEKSRIKLGEGLCGWSALHKQPVLVGDVREDPRYLKLIPQTRSELVVPLIHRDKVLGVFDLESSTPHHFTEQHLKILTALASQVAIAIDNAHLYEDLRAREARTRRELSIARGVQRELFPEEAPSGPGWEAYAQFLPAREIGGDLYDFFEFRDGTLGLAIGDVAGKGVPAALYGAFASGTVRTKAFQQSTPKELLWTLNKTLRRRGIEGLYCTLTYALFDFQARTVRLASSGLPFPLHYRAADRSCVEIDVTGLPAGAFDDVEYEEREIQLGPGDVLVFQTDGVSEARRGQEEYGREGRRRILTESASLPVREIGDRILADVNRFLAGEPPSDDVTLVVVKVKELPE